MKRIGLTLLISGVVVAGSLHAATDSRSSIKQYVDTTESILVGTVEDKGSVLGAELVLTGAYSVSKNGHRALPDAVPLNNGRSTVMRARGRSSEAPGKNRDELHSITEVNTALPEFTDKTKYLILLDESGDYSAASTFVVTAENTVKTMQGIPVVVDEKTGELRRVKLDYDLSGVAEMLLKDSDGGTDRVLYYSRAKVINEERPSQFDDVLDVIAAKLSSKR